MTKKSMIMLAMAIGSTIGAYIPVIFGASAFSMTSLITAAIGGLVGIWIAFKIVI